MLIKIIILALVQGITEFLPISSSGHLVFLQEIMGIKEDQLILDVVLHGGTLISIIFYFYKDLLKLFKGVTIKPNNESRKKVIYIIIGIIPAGIAGIFFDEWIEEHFFSIVVVQIAWLMNGANLILLDRIRDGNKPITPLKSLLIGIFQVFSLLPGISRSGTTISTGVYEGISRKEAASFSFLMAIPIMGGAVLLKVGDMMSGNFNISPGLLILGFFISFISGFFSLKCLFRFLQIRKMKIMGVYCIGMSLISFLMNIF